MSLREIRFYVDFFPEGSRRDLGEQQVLVLLEALVLLNQLYLKDNPNTPPLYQLYKEGKVKYKLPSQMEDGGVNAETFRDIPRIIENGGGDCDNLAAMRCAELRMQGIAARPYITHRQEGDRTIYHVLVLHDADGSSEDPCILCEMDHPDRENQLANEQRKQAERFAEAVAGGLQGRRGNRQALVGNMDWFLRANKR